MKDALALGALLSIISGLMNGSFTLPMRFLGRWDWEHVWSLFIVFSCLMMPTVIISLIAHAPATALLIAGAAGFAWGFGSLMFGQSVSAIGISLANTLVLAISSALGSLLPLLLLSPQKIHQPSGRSVLEGVAIVVVGITLCGYAGRLREKTNGTSERGDLVGKARPWGWRSCWLADTEYSPLFLMSVLPWRSLFPIMDGQMA